MIFEKALKVTNNNGKEILLKIGDKIDVGLTDQASYEYGVQEDKYLIDLTILGFEDDGIEVKNNRTNFFIEFEELTWIDVINQNTI